MITTQYCVRYLSILFDHIVKCPHFVLLSIQLIFSILLQIHVSKAYSLLYRFASVSTSLQDTVSHSKPDTL